MAKITVNSPAKVNLYLNVLKLQSDGYHEIQTVFNLINLEDKIRLEENSSGISVDSDSKAVPRDNKNLAWRAAGLLMDFCKIKAGVKIFIEKKIPIAAGLGGGSSNAAAVLLGLNKLWRLGLTKDTLADLGRQLGADVPFFVWEYPLALAAGIGEKITPLNCRREGMFLLVNPGIAVSTAEIYHQWDQLVLSQPGLTKPDSAIKLLIQKLDADSGHVPDLLFYNSLEPVTLSLYPAVRQVKETLTRIGVMPNLMSGSGPTVFGRVRERKEGKKLREHILLSKHWWVCLA